MFDNIREDTRRLRAIKSKPFPWYVLESLLFENGYQAVVLYRIGHWFRSRGIPLVGPLCNRLAIWLTSADISSAAEIGPGLMVGHGMGLVVGAAARIGRNALLHHQVTLGAPVAARIEQMPKLGDNVIVGAGARLIGGIEIGDNVFIGANAVVAQDIPSDCKVIAGGGLEIVPRGRPASRPDVVPAEANR